MMDYNLQSLNGANTLKHFKTINTVTLSFKMFTSEPILICKLKMRDARNVKADGTDHVS